MDMTLGTVHFLDVFSTDTSISLNRTFLLLIRGA